MATTKISTGVLKDGSVTSAKLDTNISIVGDLTVDTNTLFVDSASNRVGIGTSSPLLKLDIKGTNSLPATSGTVQNGGIRIENGVNNGVLDIGASNATGAPGWIQATDKTDLSQSYNLLLNPNGGNVGIGTSSPSAKFEIFGTGNSLRLDSAANGSKEILFRNVGTGTATIKTDGDLKLFVEDAGKNILFDTTGGERMRITSGGTLQVGATTGYTTINQGAFFTKGGGSMYTANLLAGAAVSKIFKIQRNDVEKYSIGLGGSDELAFINSSGVANMIITSTGNVGIGTSSPAYPIDIKSSTDIARFESTTNGIYNEYKTTLGTLAYVGSGSQTVSGAGTSDFGIQASLGSFVVATGGNTERMRIDSSGNVGIGVTADTKLDVYGDIKIGTTANSNFKNRSDSHWIQYNGGNTTNDTFIRVASINAASIGRTISFHTNSAQRMLITSSGTIQTNVTKALGSSTANLRLKNTTTGTNYSSGAYVNIVFGDETVANSYLGDIQVVQGDPSASTSTSMRFLTNAGGGNSFTQERMRLESDGDLHVDGDVIAYSTTISDQRLKDDIQTIDNALDKISNLRGVSYTWNNGNRKGQKDLGLIAQEVEKVLPELVREKEMPMIDGGTYKTVDYEKIVGVLIEAVKELKNEIESLKSK